MFLRQQYHGADAFAFNWYSFSYARLPECLLPEDAVMGLQYWLSGDFSIYTFVLGTSRYPLPAPDPYFICVVSLIPDVTRSFGSTAAPNHLLSLGFYRINGVGHSDPIHCVVSALTSFCEIVWVSSYLCFNGAEQRNYAAYGLQDWLFHFPTQ
jgi:hypothetical protein